MKNSVDLAFGLIKSAGALDQIGAYLQANPGLAHALIGGGIGAAGGGLLSMLDGGSMGKHMLGGGLLGAGAGYAMPSIMQMLQGDQNEMRPHPTHHPIDGRIHNLLHPPAMPFVRSGVPAHMMHHFMAPAAETASGLSPAELEAINSLQGGTAGHAGGPGYDAEWNNYGQGAEGPDIEPVSRSRRSLDSGIGFPFSSHGAPAELLMEQTGSPEHWGNQALSQPRPSIKQMLQGDFSPSSQ